MATVLNTLSVLAIVGPVLLVCRELVCWHWKINRRNALAEEQTELLRELVAAARRAEEDRLEQRTSDLKERALRGNQG